MDEAKIPHSGWSWEAVDIFLFSNGQQYSPPRKYHLTSRDLEQWPSILKHLAHTHYGAMHSDLQIYTIDGKKIEEPLQITNGTTYVAVEPPDSFIYAGYEKYLLKASRSWEKRQAKKSGSCELSAQYGNNSSNPGPFKYAFMVDILNGRNTNQNVGETMIETKVNKTFIKPKRKINQQDNPQDKINKIKKNPSLLRYTDFKKSLIKPAEDAPSKKLNQSKNYRDKGKNKLAMKPTIASSTKRGFVKSPTTEKLKERVNHTLRGPTKANSPLKTIESTTATISKIQIKNLDDNVTVSLSKKKENDMSSSTYLQVSSVFNNSKSDNADNNENFVVIQEENSKRNFQLPSIENVIVGASEHENLSTHEEYNKNALIRKSESNYSSKEYKKDKLVNDVHRTNYTQNLNDFTDNTTKLEDKCKFGEKQFSKQNVEQLSKVVSKGDVINLLLRIKFKPSEKESKHTDRLYRSKSLNSNHTEKESQVNIDMDFMVNSKTLQTLLTEDAKREDGGANSKVVVVKCTCSNSQIVTDKAINKINPYVIVLSIINCDRCKSERIDITNPNTTSNASHNNKSLQEFDEAKGDAKDIGSNHSIKSQAIWLSDEFASRKKEQDYLTIHRNTLKETVDNNSQTDWCNILLETRRHGDGHYTFHLPTLKVLKSFGF